jgi:hypothetical protein
MQSFKGRNLLLVILLAVVLLVVLCCNLPSLLYSLRFPSLCLKQDRDIPPNTEVIVSACKRPVVTGVPDGETLFVREHSSEKMYLLDLRTGEKRDVPNDPLLLDHGVFLSSELVWLEGSLVGPDNPNYRPHYILDLTDGQRYELTDVSSRIDQPEPPSYVPYFQSAEQVFIHRYFSRAIALPPNFRQNPEKGVFLYKNQLSTETDFEDGELLEIIMKDLGVDYEIVDFSRFDANAPSPTGKYIVHHDGIYISRTNTQVVTSGMGNYFRGWYYDESGVVVQGGGYYLITLPGTSSHYYIPSPVLKLRLPTP